MGRVDDSARKLLSNNGRFADLCNFYLFGGNEVLGEEDLKELDPVTLLSLQENGKKKTGAYLRRERDLLRKAVIRQTNWAVIAIIGIENQTYVNYGMPVRNMIYDGLSYAKQMEQISELHRKEQDHHVSADFLSGLKKDDCLMPVITLTVYWGTKPWDGARELHELLTPNSRELLPYVNNYRINLIEPLKMPDFSKFKTDLGSIFALISVSADKNSVKTMLKQNPVYQSLDIDAADLLRVLLDIKIDFGKDEKVNMCKAIEDMTAEARMEGLIQGMEAGIEKGIEQGIEKGKKEGMEAGKLEGRLEGRLEGKLEGRDDIVRLNQFLIHNNRMEDLVKATNNAEYREQLLQEVVGKG